MSRLPALLLLAMLAGALATPSLAQALTGPVAIISNQIDMPTAERMESVLTSMGFDVSIYTPYQFDKALEEAQFVIVLGGHKAPGGISEISGYLLSDKEKGLLEKRNYAYYFIKRASNRKPVVIVAGNDRFGTYRAANTFLIKGLPEVEKFLSYASPVLVVTYFPSGG